MITKIQKIKSKAKKEFYLHYGSLPDFLIIGAQKCGTTSLYYYLSQHPNIIPSKNKEVGYFDRFYKNGLSWYRSKFPLVFRKALFLLRGQHLKTFEASSGYILNLNALQRIKNILPNVKLILMLRNPVDRAYSHYQHSVKSGHEELSFPKALEAEKERIGNAWEKYRLGLDDCFDIKISRYAYLLAGVYVDQARHLLRLFSRDQIHIIKSETFFRHTHLTYNEVLKFLDLKPNKLHHYKKYKSGKYLPLSMSIRNQLIEHYKPFNQQLNDCLNIDFGWDT
jgi:hypothetical protein